MLVSLTKWKPFEWINVCLSSGSRDCEIINYDIRLPHYVNKFSSHTNEVCGLRWSPNKNYLASGIIFFFQFSLFFFYFSSCHCFVIFSSFFQRKETKRKEKLLTALIGGNDNLLNLWDIRQSDRPVFGFRDHTSAIKPLAWSSSVPHMLVSGGGTNDRSIRTWNTGIGKCSRVTDVKSQVCQLGWSDFRNELVSSHGYMGNEIVVWNYEHMEPVAELLGQFVSPFFFLLEKKKRCFFCNLFFF